MADRFAHVDASTLNHGEDGDSDLAEVLEAVLPLCAHWYDLGLALRIKPSSLDTIKATEPDPRKRLNALMSAWLSKQYNFNKFGNPSWRLLCQAVHSPVGGNNPALAEKIANNHFSAAPCPAKPPTTVPQNCPELKDLHNLEISDWFGLGLELGLRDDQLRIIRDDNVQNTRAQRREMFSMWLRASTKPTYQELIKALTTLGDVTIADELEKKFGKNS